MKKNTRKVDIIIIAVILLLIAAAIVTALAVPAQNGNEALPADTVQAGKTVSYKDYNGKCLGIMTGSSFEPVTLEKFPDSDYLYFNTYSDLNTALLEHRIDGYVADEPTVRFTHNENSDISNLSEPVSLDSYHFMFSKTEAGSQKLLKQFNEMLAEMKTDGTLGKLQEIWFGDDAGVQVIDRSGITGENGVITAGTCSGAVPFTMFVNGELSGLTTDLMYRFARKYGYELKFEDTDISSMLAGLAAGKYDMLAAPTSRTPEREEAADFSDPFYSANICLAVRTEDIVQTCAVEDRPFSYYADNKKIGVFTGSLYETMIRERYPDADLYQYTNQADLGAALDTGLIDCFIVPRSTAEDFRKQYDGFTYLKEVFTQIPYGFAFEKSEDKEELRDRMNGFLRKIQNDGTYDKILSVWFGDDEDKKIVDDSGLTGENGSLRVVTTATMQPFSYIKEGKNVGLEIDLVTRFCREYGYSLSIDNAEFSSLIAGIASGMYNIAAGNIMITAERAESVNFSDVYYTADAVAVVRKEAQPGPSGSGISKDTPLSYFSDKKIGILTGSAYEPVAEELFPNAEYVYFDVASDLALATVSGKIDGYLMSVDQAETMKAENPQLICLNEDAGQTPYAFAFPKTVKGAALRDEINEFLGKIRADGTMDKLLEKWTNGDLKQSVDMTGFTGEKGALGIAADGTTPPWEYTYNGKLTGYEIELAAMFCREYGYTPKFDTMTFAAVIPAISSGKYDMAAANISVTKERAESVYFSDMESGSKVVFVTADTAEPAGAKGRTISLRELDSPDRKVGYGTGTSAMFAVEKYLPDAQHIDYSDSLTGYEAVKLGMIDAFVFEKKQMQIAIDNGLTGVVLLEENLGENTEVAVGLSRRSSVPDLNKEINKFIAEMKADGTLDDMYYRWVVQGNYEMPGITKPQAPEMKIIIGTTGIVEPYSFYKDNTLTGYDIEMAERFGLWMNAEIEYKTYDYTGVISAAESGVVDCIFANLNVTDERKETIDFSDTIYTIENGVMVSAEKSIVPENNSWLDGIVQSFEKNFIREDRWKMILDGIGTTCLITVLSALCGTFLAFLVCMLRRTGSRLANAISDIYVKLLQGTPMVVLLMILYYVVFGKAGLDAVWVAVTGFSLNVGAYVSEIMRSGIESIDGGQREAALALGYSENQAFFRFIFPQASVRFLPVYKGEIVSLLKSTSIVGYIAIQDLTKMSDIIRSRTYEAFFPLIATAIIYFILAWIISMILNIVLKGISPKRKKISSK